MSPNTHPNIQLYQYKRDEAKKNRPVILLPANTSGSLNYSTEQLEAAQKIRICWQEDLDTNIKPFIKTKESFKSFTNNYGKDFGYRWDQLPDLIQSNLQNTIIQLDKTDIDGFYLNPSKTKWFLGDNFIVPLISRFKSFSDDSESNLKIAGRLFLFHEILHHCNEGHGINSTIANGIGRFPKVIEDADYQADVWAIVNHFLYSDKNEKEFSSDPKHFF